ncbi:MAG: hypothetical protein KatS3mg087_1414 [Patescibacteria group bacterium]|nr:MAG: hypothetical protein KatS3mg087_1414 [Patescibacteria group bacterium]
MTNVQKLGRWHIDSVDNVLSELVQCEDQASVWLSETCRCNRYVWRGVPAGCCDVLVDTRILSHEHDEWPLVLERSRKAGK